MGKHRSILITAGPTHEAIDSVRYVANRSSGRMGVAIAEAARDAGWNVTLLLGPGCTPPRDGVTVRDFVSTADLSELLDRTFCDCDVLIMAAAVADFRPAEPAKGKIPRGQERLVVEMDRTPDLVARCASAKKPHQFVVGFALEDPQDLQRRAHEKLRRKGLDALVANPLDTMGAETVKGFLCTADGQTLTPSGKKNKDGALSKVAFARWLIEWVGERVSETGKG